MQVCGNCSFKNTYEGTRHLFWRLFPGWPRTEWALFKAVHVENKVFKYKQFGSKSSLRCRKEVLGQKASCLELRCVFWNFYLVEFSAEFSSLTFKNAFSQLVSRFGDCSCAAAKLHLKLDYWDHVLGLSIIFKSLWERRNVSVNIQGNNILVFRLCPRWKLTTLGLLPSAFGGDCCDRIWHLKCSRRS